MENNFLSLIKTRRSVRVYKSEPVPAEALDAVLEAGTYAPTGGGRQSPTIIAITDPKYRQEIAKLNAEVMGSNADPYYCLLYTSPSPRDRQKSRMPSSA